MPKRKTCEERAEQGDKKKEKKAAKKKGGKNVWSKHYATSFPSIVKGTDESSVFCTMCKCEFGIGHSSSLEIKRHFKTAKHKKYSEDGKSQRLLSSLWKHDPHEKQGVTLVHQTSRAEAKLCDCRKQPVAVDD